MARMKPAAKFLIVLVVGAAIFGGLMLAKNYKDVIVPSGNEAGKGEIPSGMFSKKSSNDDVIDVGVVTWGGYAGGQYFNNGFEPSQSSRFYTEYGLQVKFHVIDDFDASRNAFKAGALDLLWCTIDAWPTEVIGMADMNPKVIFQADWSRGGDAIVVKPGINTTNNLLGKKIACAFGTPSHTFLIYALDAGDLNYSDVEIIEVKSAIDAAAMFKARKVDAAVVWSPDDEDCVKSVPGAKVLMSTKTAKYIIADVFVAKQAYIDANRDKLQNLYRGWMKGAAELNSSDQARRKAANILARGFDGLDATFCYNAIKNVRLCTYGDNQKFFGLSGTAGDVSGEKLFNKMGRIYKMINLVRGQLPDWSSIVDLSIVNGASDLAGATGQMAEGKTQYKKATAKVASSKAISTKRVSITFATGAYALDENAKTIIDYKFGDFVLMSSNRIRIEGNTDNTGSLAANTSLSKKRAKSVAQYLTRKYNVDPDRFIIQGNGPNKPVADNDTAEGRAKNRRTDFEMLAS